jgi:hypothetical protein
VKPLDLWIERLLFCWHRFSDPLGGLEAEAEMTG